MKRDKKRDMNRDKRDISEFRDVPIGGQTGHTPVGGVPCPPASGAGHAVARVHQGQEYREAGVRVHRKPDGSETLVTEWDTNCSDCGREFRLFTAPSKFEPNRRCQECKRPGVRVSRGALQ